MANNLSFFFHTAKNNLKRGGQRISVAILCVGFGVMSLVAMTTISSSFEKSFVVDPTLLIGADISSDRTYEPYILPEEIAKVEQLKSDQVLEDYTLIPYSSTVAFQTEGSDEWKYPSAGLGIDLQKYPLIGSLEMEGDNVNDPIQRLGEPNSILLTIDLAKNNNLQVGDSITLSDLTVGVPIKLEIVGILLDTPNHQGDKLYYSYEVAEKLANGKSNFNTLLATSDDPEAAAKSLKDLGWSAYEAEVLAEQDKGNRQMISLMLNGAGVMGLLVGGIGIANTMQVLLSRRQNEIAIWKMLGYKDWEVSIIFALEAGLIGLAGSIPGAFLGTLLSKSLTTVFSKTSTVLVSWHFNPTISVSAVLIGVLTTVIFALWAIIKAQDVAPITLLRREPNTTSKGQALKTIGLVMLLAIPFLFITAYIMGSLSQALIVLVVAILCMLVLSFALRAALWLITAILPSKLFPILNIPRKNLRRNGLTPILSGVALFIGVVTMLFASITTQSAQPLVLDEGDTWQGSNVVILAPAEEEASIKGAVAKIPTEEASIGYQTVVKSIHQVGNQENKVYPLLIGREQLEEYQVTETEFGVEDGAYVSMNHSSLQKGDSVEITFMDGSTKTVSIVGVYEVDSDRLFQTNTGLLMTSELSKQLTTPDQLQYFLKVKPETLARLPQELGEISSEVMVINLIARAARFAQSYKNLYVLAISMAALSFLAGLLLIANSVSLSTLNRRYEIGVLKCVGYSNGNILSSLMIEYLLIAVVAFLSGLIAVEGFSLIVGTQIPMSKVLLALSPKTVWQVGIVLLTLTMLSVLLVAWKPIQVSPLVVLSDGE
ncbi:MAG: FtsX-like permease family protein [Anaerolineaceae bacterium]